MTGPLLASGGAGGVLAVIVIIYVAVIVLAIAGVWKTFTKAGEAGWKAIIPIYNVYIMCKIAGKPGWWVILALIPIVNIIFLIMIYHGISTSFGKGGGFTVGLILLPFIFFPVLGFGSARYVGPGGWGGYHPQGNQPQQYGGYQQQPPQGYGPPQ